MPRPKTKNQLLEQSQQNFRKLLDHIDSFAEEEQIKDFPAGTLNRNIRDVLGHLHHWHLLFLGWYEVGMQGEKPAMPAEGYTWKDNAALNREIQQKYSEIPLPNMRAKFETSYQKMQAIIEQHSEEELFEKKRYKWTGTTSLAAYLISATSSHYDWGCKLIKRCKK